MLPSYDCEGTTLLEYLLARAYTLMKRQDRGMKLFWHTFCLLKKPIYCQSPSETGREEPLPEPLLRRRKIRSLQLIGAKRRKANEAKHPLSRFEKLDRPGRRGR